MFLFALLFGRGELYLLACLENWSWNNMIFVDEKLFWFFSINIRWKSVIDLSTLIYFSYSPLNEAVKLLFLLYRYLTKYCKIKFWYVVITFPSKQNNRTNNEEKVDSFLYIVLMCNQIFTDNWVSWLRNSMLYNNHYNQLLAKSAKNFPSLLWFPFSVMIRKIKKLFYEITGRVGRFVTRMTMILGKAIIHLTIEIREDSV